MNQKLSKILAVVCSLALCSIALAQGGETTATDWTQIFEILSPLAAIIWLILFTAWGGFRWFY